MQKSLGVSYFIFNIDGNVNHNGVDANIGQINEQAVLMLQYANKVGANAVCFSFATKARKNHLKKYVDMYKPILSRYKIKLGRHFCRDGYFDEEVFTEQETANMQHYIKTYLFTNYADNYITKRFGTIKSLAYVDRVPDESYYLGYISSVLGNSVISSFLQNNSDSEINCFGKITTQEVGIKGTNKLLSYLVNPHLIDREFLNNVESLDSETSSKCDVVYKDDYTSDIGQLLRNKQTQRLHSENYSLFDILIGLKEITLHPIFIYSYKVVAKKTKNGEFVLVGYDNLGDVICYQKWEDYLNRRIHYKFESNGSMKFECINVIKLVQQMEQISLNQLVDTLIISSCIRFGGDYRKIGICPRLNSNPNHILLNKILDNYNNQLFSFATFFEGIEEVDLDNLEQNQLLIRKLDF